MIKISHLSFEELAALNVAVVERMKFLRGLKNANAAAAFSVGDRVEFGKGVIRSGVVEKVNVKKIKVKVGPVVWVVPAGLLRSVGGA